VVLHYIALSAFPLVFALSVPLCAPVVEPTAPPAEARISELWEEPRDIGAQDLFNGPWGAAHAPDPDAVYTFIRPKEGGVNPGVVVRDAVGREWHVKQPHRGGLGDEGPVEVVLSRVLSGLGYHQPPVYFLRSFAMKGPSGTRTEWGGRFRLQEPWLIDRGSWSWQQNPFVNTRPYNGLLVILLMFNSSDLKNSNNTLYDVAHNQRVDRWYVVRDLGSALGKTSRFRPIRNEIDRFERTLFIRQVADGFVEFDYHGLHQELVRRRISPADVGWANALLERLSARQWHDAFRAGGYPPNLAARFIHILHARIAQARQIAAGDLQPTEGQ
jgi:hypothetical protein